MLVPLCFLRSQINKKLYRNRHKQAHPRKRRYVDGIHGHRPIAFILFKGEVLCSSYYTFGKIRNHKVSFQNHKCNDTRPVKGLAIFYILQCVIVQTCLISTEIRKRYSNTSVVTFAIITSRRSSINNQRTTLQCGHCWTVLRCTSFPQGKTTSVLVHPKI